MGWRWKAVRAVWTLGLFLVLEFSYSGSETRMECVYSCFLDWLLPRLSVNLHRHRRTEPRICYIQAFEETNKKHLPELWGRYELFAKCRTDSSAEKWGEPSRPLFWLQSHCLWVCLANLVSLGDRLEQRSRGCGPSVNLFSRTARCWLFSGTHVACQAIWQFSGMKRSLACHFLSWVSSLKPKEREKVMYVVEIVDPSVSEGLLS